MKIFKQKTIKVITGKFSFSLLTYFPKKKDEEEEQARRDDNA
jgi:hypothetical protein